MERDNGKKIEEVLQGSWVNFHNTLREYMLQKVTTKGMQQLWEHFQLYLCILEQRSGWDKSKERQAFLISEEVIPIKIETGWKDNDVFKKAEEEAIKVEERNMSNSVWSVRSKPSSKKYILTNIKML